MKTEKTKEPAQNSGRALEITLAAIADATPHMDEFIGKMQEVKRLTNGARYKLAALLPTPPVKPPTRHTDPLTGATGLRIAGIEDTFFSVHQAAVYLNVDIGFIKSAITEKLLCTVEVNGSPAISQRTIDLLQNNKHYSAVVRAVLG